MSCHFDFDLENRVLRIRLEGAVTAQAMMEYYQAAGECVLRTRPRAGIWDMTPVTSLEFTTDDVARLARSVPALPEPDRRRIIVAPSPHIFGMARMFQALGQANRPRLQVAHTLEEACALLGVKAARFEPVPPPDQGKRKDVQPRS